MLITTVPASTGKGHQIGNSDIDGVHVAAFLNVRHPHAFMNQGRPEILHQILPSFIQSRQHRGTSI